MAFVLKSTTKGRGNHSSTFMLIRVHAWFSLRLVLMPAVVVLMTGMIILLRRFVEHDAF